MSRAPLTRVFSVLVVVALACSAIAVPSVAHAQGGGTPSGCGGSASAIDQYCEVIPSPKGGHGTGPGTPLLVSQLPRGAIDYLLGDSRRAPLLTLPAPVRLPQAGQNASSGGSSRGGLPSRHGIASSVNASTGSLWWSWVLILAAIALGLAAVEVGRRRTQRPAQGT